MAQLIAFRCSNCRTEYALPDVHRPQLEGRALFCPAFKRWWLGIPSSSGPPVKLVDGRPERSRVDLRKFRRQPTAPQPAAPSPGSPTSGAPTGCLPALSADAPSPGSPTGAGARSGRDRLGGGRPHRTDRPPPAAPPAGPRPVIRQSLPQDASTTMRVPVTAPGRPSSLRLVVDGPDTDHKGVFELGDKSFLIGEGGCHLNLPHASIPQRAIRIRAAVVDFTFEGLDGFPIPIGAVSVILGRIEPGKGLQSQLGPYRIQVSARVTPGSPIADLDSPAQDVAPAAASPPAPAAVPELSPPVVPELPPPVLPPAPPSAAPAAQTSATRSRSSPSRSVPISSTSAPSNP